MSARAFAGTYAPHGDGPPSGQERALAADGEAAGAVRGALAAAWTPPDGACDEPVLCVIDGRIRTGALAGELGIDPAQPAERVVAEAYALIGERLLPRLDGEYALLVWSEPEQRGLLARDRSGARPLFLAPAGGGGLRFASEVRNLLAMLPSRPAPDAVAMAHWLARAPAPERRTLYEGIERLPPGHMVRLHAGRSDVLPFWRPRPAAALELGADGAAVAVREAVGAAVERALAGARRPGLMLSGGLDSATVAAATVRAGTRPTTYSGIFPAAPEVDESARIRRVRDWLGLDGVEAELGSGSALAAAAEFTRLWELPALSPNRFVWRPLLARAAADGTDVLLDGEGGDELFGCARYLVADRLLRRGPLSAARIARRLPGMGARPRPRWIARALAVYGVRGALPPVLHEALRATRGAGAGPDWLRAPVADARWAWKARPGPRWWAQLAHVLVDDRLGAADHHRREAAAHGLELRHPLRDPELIDLMLRLPPALGFDPELDRPLVRRALEDELPGDVLGTTAKPFFNVLLERALAGPDRDSLRRLVTEPAPELAALIREGAVRGLLNDPSGTRAIDLWRLATLQLWLAHQADPGAISCMVPEASGTT